MADLLQEYCQQADRREAETKGQTVAGKTTEPPLSPLHARLRSDIENLEGQQQRSFRALQILSAHPEFEEFIELLGLIRVDIRFRPIHSDRALVIE